VLQAQGHSLLAAGESAAAVSILERAVASTGEQLSDCLEPTTQNCLTYAYALFDLGRALQLTGQAQSAVAVLEQRLKIDNQRPEVAAQLASARQG
jgi:tetratricopeptide (TPR) repeat protein